MRLIGSMIEQKCRAELIAGRNELMRGEGDARSMRLRSLLKTRGADLSRAYVIHWIPDQGEDYYEVLLESEVLCVEIPHDDSMCKVDSVTLSAYRSRRHSRLQFIKLEVALNLLASNAPHDPA